jgi:multidrug resistance efflux pump
MSTFTPLGARRFLGLAACLLLAACQGAPAATVTPEAASPATGGQFQGRPITGTGQTRGGPPGQFQGGQISGTVPITRGVPGQGGPRGEFTGTLPFSGTFPITGTGQGRGPNPGQPVSGTVTADPRPTAVAAIAQATVAPAARATSAPAGATVASVSAAGALALASPPILAGFETSGKVTAVQVIVGQSVKKGELLAELDPADLETALRQAKDALTLKQANIAASLEPAKEADISVAKSSVATAWAAYADVADGSSAADIANALRSWNQARNSLYSSQLGRDASCHVTNGATPSSDAQKEPACKTAQYSVQTSEMRERSAYQAYLDIQQPASSDALSKAWSSVAQAQSSLAALVSGPTTETKKVYDLQLEQARISVARAERDLARARLLSPCDCVVSALTLTPGANASGGISLIMPDRLVFKATNISERDVVAVQPGQAVSLRLKAFDQAFTGKVAAVLPLSSGLQTTTALYTVLIDLDATPTALLPGMTGQADIRIR